MIVEFLVGFALFNVILPLLGALVPDVTTIVPDVSSALEGVATLNAFIPVTETLGAALFLLGVQGAMFLLKLVLWLKTHVPFVGGSG